MVPADRLADKPGGVPPHFEIRLLGDRALRQRIICADGLYRNALESGDAARAAEFAVSLDAAWAEVRHRTAEKRRRLIPASFAGDCFGHADRAE
jgi:hypothetical protein